jgi:RHS repeat-associated protein
MLSDGVVNYTYDSANRLVAANGHTYTYNAEDVRIRNLCEEEDTTYVYNTNCRLSQLLVKTTNGVATKYVYGHGLIGEEVGNTFKTYHFDCRGSTVAITDANGNITDTFKYDTYGKLISRTGTSDVIFGYNGRDGVVSDGNGLIYMRARYYSPEMKRFINADIIAGEISNAVTLNRFAYANGNPVSFVDPFGLSSKRGQGPTELEAAYMAKHIYHYNEENPVELIGGWVFETEKLVVGGDGMVMGVYSRDDGNGNVEYTLVNRGTVSWSLFYSDIYNNLSQPIGLSNDMKASIQAAENFAKNNPYSRITFVGHSKGGAEAIANAVATGKDAIVFNPATAMLSEYGLDADAYEGKITSYVVEGEILDGLSVVLGKNIGEEIQLVAPPEYNPPDFQWDSLSAGAQEPWVQAGQYLGGLFVDAYYGVEKHSIDLVIDLLG